VATEEGVGVPAGRSMDGSRELGRGRGVSKAHRKVGSWQREKNQRVPRKKDSVSGRCMACEHRIIV